MNQPRCRRGCGAAEVALLEQDHAQAASRGVARHADAVQTPADDREIVVRHTQAIAFSDDVNIPPDANASGPKNFYPILRTGATGPARPIIAKHWPIGAGLPMK